MSKGTQFGALSALIVVSSVAGLLIKPSSAWSISPPPAQAALPPPPPPESEIEKEKLVIAGEEFELEIAADEESRAKGLMDRDTIDEHGGMLFIYPWPQMLGFWMKNCLIEMDILFVSDKGVITATHRMKPPPPKRPGQSEADYDNALPRYESRRPAQFAIELKAGTIERLKIKVGDRIEMDVERLENLANPKPNDNAWHSRASDRVAPVLI